MRIIQPSPEVLKEFALAPSLRLGISDPWWNWLEIYSFVLFLGFYQPRGEYIFQTFPLWDRCWGFLSVSWLRVMMVAYRAIVVMVEFRTPSCVSCINARRCKTSGGVVWTRFFVYNGNCGTLKLAQWPKDKPQSEQLGG
ncbi:hypothetical protein HNY73_021768 [Argiope bruennichi]|uniref:Uncharacterized protein n=1 Tax=Argiope bruennichi TaxID=94029 RepID=A0A8T0E0H1_ARGBR|nr:hypothetical protein HNY73_021768 [Argiope bruennichi]